MAKTKSVTDPSPGFLKRIFGSKSIDTDIELPNESGREDKRLKKKSTLSQIKEGYGIFKNLGKQK
jgi:hypothetical protein